VDDVIYGLVAIAAGALFCFRGYLAFRFIIPLWGAFVGFSFGAGLIAEITGDGFLSTTMSWLVGLAFAFVFALLSYLFFAVAVVIAMGSIGFALGTSLMVAFGITWTWLIVLAGFALGVLLAFIAIAANMPMVVLIVLSALAGASALPAGIMLLVGAVDTDEFGDKAVTELANNDWWWYAVFAIFALVGLLAQVRSAERLRGSMRDAWAAEHGGAPG
jgi:Domain of unknown function (DUF4203)